jgi:hypothetical protein
VRYPNSAYKLDFPATLTLRTHRASGDVTGQG